MRLEARPPARRLSSACEATMRPKMLQRAGPVVSSAVLFLFLGTLAYQLALHWPVLCLFSDLKSLLTDQRVGRSLPLWRLGFAFCISAALTGCAWLSFYRYRASRRFLPLAAMFLPLAFVAFYPEIREFVLGTVIRSGPSTVVIEAVMNLGSIDPHLHRPIRLTLGTRLKGVAPGRSLVWFGGAESCHIDLADQQVQKLASSSGLLQLPPELEPEGALAHDWMRVSFVGGRVNLNTLGLQRAGRHSGRFRGAVISILEGARKNGLPECFSLLVQELDPGNWKSHSEHMSQSRTGRRTTPTTRIPRSVCFTRRTGYCLLRYRSRIRLAARTNLQPPRFLRGWPCR